MARHERSAGFIIYHAGTDGDGEVEYLVLDYGRHWDFPKGHVEAGEDDLAAAVRELHEETGLTDPRVVPGFRHEITYFFRSRRRGKDGASDLVRKTVVFFLAEVTCREIALSREHAGFEFLRYDVALKRTTYASAKEVLRLAHAYLLQSHGEPVSSAKASD